MKRKILSTAGMLALVAFLTVVTSAQSFRPGISPMEMMDTNGDGKISREEWTAFHSKMFQKLDKNGDGYLTEEELRAPLGKDEGRMNGDD